MTDPLSIAEAAVRARIATAARKRAARRRQRAEFAERRRYGLAARHRAKLARQTPDPQPPTAA